MMFNQLKEKNWIRFLLSRIKQRIQPHFLYCGICQNQRLLVDPLCNQDISFIKQMKKWPPYLPQFLVKFHLVDHIHSLDQ